MEDAVGLLLEFSCDFTGVAISLSSIRGQLVKRKLLFLLNLEQVHLNSVVAT